MSTATNKELARQYIEELWNNGRLELASTLLAPGYAVHDPGTPGRQGGIEGEKEAVSLYRSAFPDLHFTIEDLIAEGDRVVVRWSARGTHLGDLMGMPPTGRQGSPTGMSILHCVDGKIHEHWHNWDTLGLMQQLGVIPQPT